jgi:hypothetical protein
MVSISRLPPSIHPQQKTQVLKPAAVVNNTQSAVITGGVSKSVPSPDVILNARANIQYDQPEGINREALDSYLGVMHQNKRDELSNLVGVDLYA